jgi:cellobiose phosphorylase
MDTTCAYNGGENRWFMRAETAASFAREVSLHYVHAHIRFIEAMAKRGNAKEAWKGLLQINPILLKENVENAAPRQSNAYFSSSDAAFENRYDAMENFGKIKAGQIPVKGGWRSYSSGPGIYLHQLITRFLGLQIRGRNVVLDPILPKELDRLIFHYEILDKPVEIQYFVEQEGPVSKIVIDGKTIDFERTKEPYRLGGAIFAESLIQNGSKIEVYL